MINIKEIFDNDNVAQCVSLWLSDNCDGSDLAGAAEYAAEMKLNSLSVTPKDVPVIWPWVEKIDVKIIARFYVDSLAGQNVSNLVVGVNSVFKQGASGAQIILPLSELEHLSDSLSVVREDLFFNKELSVGLDVLQVWPLDWANVFDNLKKINATSLLLILNHDDMEKSDFTGRIYGALECWNASPDMELHVMFGESHGRAEQVYRLVAINRPELLNKLKFFVSY